MSVGDTYEIQIWDDTSQTVKTATFKVVSVDGNTIQSIQV